MARPGITYQDVVNAANQVKGQGKPTTIENIRAVLGTGSISTINMHLRKWKQTENHTNKIATKENLPPALVSLVQGLWQNILQSAEDKIALSEESYQTLIQTLQQDLDKYKGNNHRWQTLHNQWLQEKTRIVDDKAMLEQTIQSQDKELAALALKMTALNDQVTEKHERVAELNRLHKQSQENLEHYREAAREQRLLDQEQFERQIQELQSELRKHNQQLTQMLEKATETQQQFKSLQHTHDTQSKMYQELLGKHESLTKKAHDTESLLRDAEHKARHWLNEYKNLQTSNIQYARDLSAAQTECQLQTQHLKNVQQLLEDLKTQNSALTHDKWILMQEKSQLEGQLKQMGIILESQTA